MARPIPPQHLLVPVTGAAGFLGESSQISDLVWVTLNVSRVRFQMRGTKVDVRSKVHTWKTPFPLGWLLHLSLWL